MTTQTVVIGLARLIALVAIVLALVLDNPFGPRASEAVGKPHSSPTTAVQPGR